MALFKAKALGFDGIKVRVIGEVFEYEGPLGSWMEAVETEVPKVQAKVVEKSKHEPKKNKEDK